jgi:uncharacterized protein (TIGR00255 family)
MPLSSMTGFASFALEIEGSSFVWEVRSVNARGLDIRVRLPPGAEQLEPQVRAVVRKHLTRGSCQIALQASETAGRVRLVLDDDALALALAAAVRLAAIEGIAPARADGILALPGVLREVARSGSDADAGKRDAALLAGLAEALAALTTSRSDEGERLGAVLEQQLATLSQLTDSAAALARETVEQLKSRIAEQVALLTGAGAGLDPDRLHQEAVLAATRADVREEIDRLQSHVAGARQLLATGNEVGRRLDFLAQELNREANTLCAKAVDRRLTTVGMEMKPVIDQLREQVQNIE